MTSLAAKVISVAGQKDESVQSVQFGTQYQARLVALNPPPPTGQLRPRAEGDLALSLDSRSVALEDVCGGTNTNGIGYSPNYNGIQGQPIVYENGQVYVEGESGTAFLSERTIVDVKSSEVRVYRLVGDVTTRTSASAVSVELTDSETHGVSESTDIDTITFPSALSPSDWEDTLVADPNDRLNGVTNTTDGVRINLPDDSYTLKCYSVGIGDQDPDPAIAAEFRAGSEGVADKEGVGHGDESTFPNKSSATLSTKGGLWKNITDVDAINLTNPRFSSIKASDGQLQSQDWSLHTVLGIRTADSETEYFINVGDKEGIQIGADEEPPTWGKKDMTVIRREPDGTITESSIKIDANTLSIEAFRNGTAFNPLNISQVEAGTTSQYTSLVYEIRADLNAPSTSELFVADQHGRVGATLTTNTYRTTTGNDFLVADDGSANTEPTAVDISGTSTYSGAKIGVYNIEGTPIDSVDQIRITVPSTDSVETVNASAYPGREDDSYGTEVYFDGNNNDGKVSGTIQLVDQVAFDQVGDIDEDSGVVLKFSEFLDDSGNRVDMTSETVVLEITFEADGQTYTDTIRTTLDAQESA